MVSFCVDDVLLGPVFVLSLSLVVNRPRLYSARARSGLPDSDRRAK